MAVNNADIMKEEMKKSVEKFKHVQTRVFQVNKLLQGLSTFVQIGFDREFTSVCSCTLHGSIIDYRFRVQNQRNLLKNVTALDSKDGDTFVENGVLVEHKYVEVDQRPRKRWLPSNVAEYFFCDEFGFMAMNERKIHQCYSEFMETMSFVHANIKNQYVTFTQKILYEDDLDQIDFPRIPLDIEVQGLSHYLDTDPGDKLKSHVSLLKAPKLSHDDLDGEDQRGVEEQTTASQS